MLFASITNVAIMPMLSEFLQEELITDQLFVGQTTWPTSVDLTNVMIKDILINHKGLFKSYLRKKWV